GPHVALGRVRAQSRVAGDPVVVLGDEVVAAGFGQFAEQGVLAPGVVGEQRGLPRHDGADGGEGQRAQAHGQHFTHWRTFFGPAGATASGRRRYSGRGSGRPWPLCSLPSASSARAAASGRSGSGAAAASPNTSAYIRAPSPTRGRPPVSSSAGLT